MWSTMISQMLMPKNMHERNLEGNNKALINYMYYSVHLMSSKRWPAQSKCVGCID